MKKWKFGLTIEYELIFYGDFPEGSYSFINYSITHTIWWQMRRFLGILKKEKLNNKTTEFLGLGEENVCNCQPKRPLPPNVGQLGSKGGHYALQVICPPPKKIKSSPSRQPRANPSGTGLLKELSLRGRLRHLCGLWPGENH